MGQGESTVTRDIAAILLRVLEILRPRFYNRITWLMVVSGIAMMSTPLWELIASAILKRQFDISISGSNDAAWGFALCVLGLLYHMANTGFYDLLQNSRDAERKRREQVHDAEIFRKASEILSEGQLVGFIRELEDDHSYYLDEANVIDRFCRLLATTDSSFLNPILVERVSELLVAWNRLSAFKAVKFFVYPRGQTGPGLRLCMTPELNMDREGNALPEEMRRYNALRDELEVLTGDMLSRFNEFRAAVKRELVI
jgi:hypothetical protein